MSSSPRDRSQPGSRSPRSRAYGWASWSRCGRSTSIWLAPVSAWWSSTARWSHVHAAQERSNTGCAVDRTGAGGNHFVAGGRRVLLRVDLWQPPAASARALTTGRRQSGGRVGWTSLPGYPDFGWYVGSLRELPSEDVAIALWHTDGGQLVRRLYGHRDRERALDRVTVAICLRHPAPIIRITRHVRQSRLRGTNPAAVPWLMRPTWRVQR